MEHCFYHTFSSQRNIYIHLRDMMSICSPIRLTGRLFIPIPNTYSCVGFSSTVDYWRSMHDTPGSIQGICQSSMLYASAKALCFMLLPKLFDFREVNIIKQTHQYIICAFRSINQPRLMSSFPADHASQET